MSDIERMTAAEIRRNYNEAKDKPEQITILADMNCCKRSDIKKIIDGETDELPPLNDNRGYTKRAKPSAARVAASDEVKREIIRLNKEGRLGKDIAKAVGRSPSFVSTTLKQYAEGKMTFAEEQTAEQREQLTAEISGELREAPIEVIPLEAPAMVEELVAMEAETAHLLPEGATALDIADALMQLLEEEFAGYIIEIKADKKYYHVRVTDEQSGDEVQYQKQYQKRRTDL